MIHVRLTKAEYQHLQQKMEESAALSEGGRREDLSKYIRKIIFERTGWKGGWMKAELRNISYQIRKIGVNVNQIAKKINSGYRGRDEIARLEEHFGTIEQHFEELLKKMEGEHGYDDTDAHKA